MFHRSGKISDTNLYNFTKNVKKNVKLYIFKKKPSN